MTTQKKLVIQRPVRERYCEIRATTLEQVLETCERHLSNIGKQVQDLLDCEDGTESDFFYLNQMRGTWADLRDDVYLMLQNEKCSKSYEHLLACYLSGQVTEEQLTQHLEDEHFAAWYKKHGKKHG